MHPRWPSLTVGDPVLHTQCVLLLNRIYSGLAHLCWGVLIALYFVERLLRCVDNKFRRVVAEETLTHVDDGLLGRCGGGLIDDGPAQQGQIKVCPVSHPVLSLTKHPRADQQHALLA